MPALTPKQAAQFARVSERQIRRYVAHGLIHSHTAPNGRRLIDEASLVDYLSQPRRLSTEYTPKEDIEPTDYNLAEEVHLLREDVAHLTLLVQQLARRLPKE